MKALVHQIAGALGSGQGVELVSVVASSGSTPRGAGALLAVFPDGRTCGTVGGGNVEYEAGKLAAELLARGENAVRDFRFVQGDAASLGMVCGGDVRLHFQYLSPEEPAVRQLVQTLLDALEVNADAWLVRKMDGERVDAMLVSRRLSVHDAPPFPHSLLQNRAVMQDGWFAVPFVRAGRTYVFGGGHVSQALVPVIAAVGFRPVVYDDRKEFADPTLFPAAEKAIYGDFLRLDEHLTITPDDYVVIMTRGHQADYEVLTQVLRSGAKYIGCIGSKRKLAICRERLLAAGFTAEEYQRLHAPIGLAIGAETPEEIAVSVAAEMISVRAGLEK